MTKASKPFVSFKVSSDHDVLWARRRTRQIAHLLGMDSANQVRFATALSEIARNAVSYANECTIRFAINEATIPISIDITVSDKGPGINDVEQFLSGKQQTLGLSGAKRLVDRFEIETNPSGTTVLLGKHIGSRHDPFSPTEVDRMIQILDETSRDNPVDELHAQNQELLAALDLISQQTVELSKAKEEVEVRAQARAHQLTAEIELQAESLRLARDEAIAASEAKSRFLSVVSHEVRTPLAGVIGFVELLNADAKDDQTRMMTEAALESCKRLLQMLNNLLDTSRLRAGRLTLECRPFAIYPVIGDTVQLVKPEADSKGILLASNVAADVPQIICGDEVRVRQILLNLLFNAVKFTDKGEVKISISVLRQSASAVTLSISVQDTGIGIHQDHKEKLFEPFTQADDSMTRRFGGSGLGLAICQTLTHLMKGEIGFDSELGEGSTFWVHIPFEESACQLK